AQRRLAINEIRPEAPYHPNPRWHVDVRAILDGCDAIFVEGSAEEDALAPLGVEPSKLAAVPTPVPAPPQVRAELVGALCGSEGFVLLHAPIEPTQNQLQAVRAAQRADLPLVVCGPVIDAEYLSLVREFAGDRTVVVAEPDEGTLEALYRSAEVFLDAAWVGCGLSRAVRAVSRGAALALSNRLPVADLQMGEFARTVDPGDVAALARGLGDAWYARRNEPERFEQARLEGVARRGVRQVTRSIVLAYAQALERRKAPVLR
ncbi:MAG: hypothetical protein JO359_03005, partial [Candidatus Eremiobacteraeota bacterium]|nr:hypothetical protein [Candidatus Eremiobacteraeota bacterium]